MNGKSVFPTSSFEARCDGCSLREMNKLMCKYGSEVKRRIRNFIKVLLDLFYDGICAH